MDSSPDLSLNHREFIIGMQTIYVDLYVGLWRGAACYTDACMCMKFTIAMSVMHPLKLIQPVNYILHQNEESKQMMGALEKEKANCLGIQPLPSWIMVGMQTQFLVHFSIV